MTVIVERQAVQRSGIDVTWEVITPDVAREMLERNTGNRNIRGSRVDQYAKDMAVGRWSATGDGLRFDPDGTLLDGQHRLLAVVKADVPVGMYVFRNVPLAARAAIDTGGKRTAGDYLQWAGEKEAALLAGAARLAVGVERFGGDAGAVKHLVVSPGEVKAYVDANPGMREAAIVAHRLRAIGVKPSALCYCIWKLSAVDEVKALEFFYSLAEREGLFRGDPRHVLARRLETARLQRMRLPAVVEISLIFRAWNAWRKGEQMQFLRINSSAGGDVPIPTPI